MKLETDIEKQEKEEEGIELKVKMSPISGSGIARVNSEIVEKGDYMEGKPHLIQFGDRKRVVRLVADGMMDKGMISLRRKDIEKIGAEEEDTIKLFPSMRMGERLQRGLDLFFRRDE